VVEKIILASFAFSDGALGSCIRAHECHGEGGTVLLKNVSFCTAAVFSLVINQSMRACIQVVPIRIKSNCGHLLCASTSRLGKITIILYH
jgi:hypothetical protein